MNYYYLYNIPFLIVVTLFAVHYWFARAERHCHGSMNRLMLSEGATPFQLSILEIFEDMIKARYDIEKTTQHCFIAAVLYELGLVCLGYCVSQYSIVLGLCCVAGTIWSIYTVHSLFPYFKQVDYILSQMKPGDRYYKHVKYIQSCCTKILIFFMLSTVLMLVMFVSCIN